MNMPMYTVMNVHCCLKGMFNLTDHCRGFGCLQLFFYCIALIPFSWWNECNDYGMCLCFWRRTLGHVEETWKERLDFQVISLMMSHAQGISAFEEEASGTSNSLQQLDKAQSLIGLLFFLWFRLHPLALVFVLIPHLKNKTMQNFKMINCSCLARFL